MARNFVRASDEYLELLSAPITAAPFTISALARTDTDTTSDDYCIAQIQNSAVSGHYWRLNADGSGAEAGDFSFSVNAAGSFEDANSGLIPVVGTWYHVAAIAIASDSRKILVDGTNEATNTVLRTPTNIDSISIGRERDSTPSDSWSGDIAEVAVWNVALMDAEVAILAARYSPLFVRPGNLVFYSLLVRSLQERISGNILTANGTTVAAHPAIIYPSPPFFAAAVAAAGFPWPSPRRHPGRNVLLRL